MNESLDRLESLFVAALQEPPIDRPAYLDQACADDPALRERVEALLRAEGAAGDFLESPAASPVVTVDEQPAGAQTSLSLPGQVVVQYVARGDVHRGQAAAPLAPVDIGRKGKRGTGFGAAAPPQGQIPGEKGPPRPVGPLTPIRPPYASVTS